MLALGVGRGDRVITSANTFLADANCARYVGAEIVGMVYGSADKAGEIRDNVDLVKKAYELGKQLGSGV